MIRKLAWMVVVAAVALPVTAFAAAASISGHVKNSEGVPQMGAAVEVFTSSTQQAIKVFTDDRGFYSATGLAPGTYFVKVSASSFLPTLRENVALASGAHLVINLTLNTLFEAIQFISPRERAQQEEDDWKWTLRSTVNRPVLRLRDNGPLVVVAASDKADDRALKASVAFLAGGESEGLGGSSDMTASFALERSLFSSGTLTFHGNVAQGVSNPSTILRAQYSHRMPNGSNPEVAFTFRRLASPDDAFPGAALEAMALSMSDTIALADFIELQFGGELQSVEYRGRASALRPFGSVNVHLTPNTVLSYRYVTSQPTTRLAKGFDTAPADLSESGPRMTLSGNTPRLEHARHQEIAVSRRLGGNNFQAAVYRDSVSNTALGGVGEAPSGTGEFLADVYSGSFTFNGGNFSSDGVRLVWERRLAQDITATLGYAFGGVLELPEDNLAWEQVRALLQTARRHAVTARFAGHLPRAKTRWIASYKWTNSHALTPVDMFDASPGQADPYLSLFVRQPLPHSASLPGQMEALIDVRNLLAQGYVPVLGQDGRTLYLVQSARSIRGGIAFTF